jgi:hypothetical protein
MAASDESNYSSNEDDNPNFAAKAQGRLLQVRFLNFLFYKIIFSKYFDDS